MLKRLLFISLLTVTSLVAESKVLFALNNQYFSETMPKGKSEKPKAGPMVGARYDVGDVIVSTNLSRWSTGVLGTLKKRNDGYFIVDIIEPVKEWTVSADVSYRFLSECRESTSYSIRLGANNGESLYITTNPCDVVVQDKQFNIRKNRSLDGVSLNYFVKNSGENIIVMLNGQKLIKFPKGEFDRLKTVEMAIGVATVYGNPSHIKNLTISQKR